MRVLVACVGNPLRGDDGFGTVVAAELQAGMPDGADVIETGIGGIAIVHQLMDRYDGLIIVDAVERSAPPGTVFVLVPQVPHVETPTFDEWRAQLADLHLAEPSRVLRIARAAGVLPPQVLVVGCQPESCEDFEEGLSPAVAEAVPVAAAHVRRLAHHLTDASLSAPGSVATSDRAPSPGSAKAGEAPCAHCGRSRER